MDVCKGWLIVGYSISGDGATSNICCNANSVCVRWQEKTSKGFLHRWAKGKKEVRDKQACR